MIVTLDGQRLDANFPSEAPLGTLIEQVRTQHAAGRLVISIALNGQKLGDTTLQTALQQPVPDGAQVDLESGDPYQLVSDAMRGLSMQFNVDESRFQEIAGRLEGGDVAEAVREVGQLIQLWQTCQQALTQCSGILNDDLTAYVHEGRPVREALEGLIGQLTDLRQALESQDVVMLGDIVRYEMPGLFEKWQGLTADLAEQVAANAPTVS